jgi:hypothetical protein
LCSALVGPEWYVALQLALDNFFATGPEGHATLQRALDNFFATSPEGHPTFQRALGTVFATGGTTPAGGPGFGTGLGGGLPGRGISLVFGMDRGVDKRRGIVR